jgi:hypothetical protein
VDCSDRQDEGQPVAKSEFVQSTEESGQLQRFDSDWYKAASRTSLGVTNSVSHSSYNSANEARRKYTNS